MRSAYPLEALHRLREEICRGVERELAGATARLSCAEEEILEIDRALEESRERLVAAADQALSPDRRSLAVCQRQRLYIERLTRELEDLKQRGQEARAIRDERRSVRDAALKRLIEARASLKVVKKNREVWDLSRRREEQRRAEEELEEIVAHRRHTRD